MSGFRLAISLLRIPRLFVSLLLFPLFLSIILVVVQLWMTTFAMRSVTQTPGTLKERLEYSEQHNWVRTLVYGSGERIGELQVCRWESYKDENGEAFELYPKAHPDDNTCAPDRLDVAIHVSDPQTFNATNYEQIFTGNFERLHICKTDCKPDVIISPEIKPARADAHSLPALLLLNQAHFDEPVRETYVDFFEDKYEIIQLIGTQFLHADGYISPIQVTNVTYELGLLVSIASIVIIGLWLAIKAHRKVLDYFARSGALLPMVAAMGKKQFYSAIWIVTLLRVGAFLLASVPATYALFGSLGTEEQWGGIFEKDVGHFLMWLVALVASFSFAAIVASVADLKHRYHLFAICYRYLPLALAVIGGFLWVGTFILSDWGGAIRNVITALPIVGMGPIILVPLFQPRLDILVINTLLTGLLTLLLVRSNARWFAAHLEDL